MSEISTDERCKHCFSKTRHICPTCHGPFCEMHQSSMDPNYCTVCLSENQFEVKEEPLSYEDEDTGELRVTNGRHLTFGGSLFQTLPKAISEMSGDELSNYIRHMKELISKSEKTIEYQKIALSTAQMESENRFEIERRRLRGIKITSPGIAKITSTREKPVKTLESLASRLKAIGVTPEALLSLYNKKKEEQK